MLVDPVVFDEWPVLEVEAFDDLVGADDADACRSDEAGGRRIPIAAAAPAATTKTAFTDKKHPEQNYLSFWGRGPGLTGFKSLVKVCTEPSNKETMAVDHSKIKCPTMVCCAQHDAWMPVEAGRRLKRAIGGPVRFEVIERCRALRAGGSAGCVGRLHRRFCNGMGESERLAAASLPQVKALAARHV